MTEPLDWYEFGPVASIPRQSARTTRTDDGQIAVFRTVDDRIFAIPDRCPHRGGPLSEGIVHGHKVTCPLHNWVIDLATGNALGADDGCAGRIPVRIENGRIMLGLTRAKAEVPGD